MENELFLKKFKGSCELLGKEGPIGILNHLHNNITGFKPKKVRIKKPEKKLEADYSYITSIVKEEFNKNKDFIPQLNVLLNQMKYKTDQMICNNIIKIKEKNRNEEKNNLFNNNKNISNTNVTNSINKKILIKKIKKAKTDNIRLKYINKYKKIEQNKEQNYKLNDGQINQNRLLFKNNKSNIDNEANTKKILPLIYHSQDLKHYSGTNRQINKNESYFAPNVRRLFSVLHKKSPSHLFISSKNNYENNEILKKSISTMNISAINKNIFTKKSDSDLNNYRYFNEIDENKKHMVNQILLNKSDIQNKKIINNDNKINSNNYENNNGEKLNYNKIINKSSIIENKLHIINETNEENNKMDNKKNNMTKVEQPNLLKILMQQRQQYFKNIENSIKYKKYMSIDN